MDKTIEILLIMGAIGLAITIFAYCCVECRKYINKKRIRRNKFLIDQETMVVPTDTVTYTLY